MSEKPKRDDDGAEYEEIECEHESGDGEGDAKWVLDNGVLTREEIAALGE